MMRFETWSIFNTDFNLFIFAFTPIYLLTMIMTDGKSIGFVFNGEESKS